MAVKRTPWLRNNCNVLLARLAGTDLITGALGQPLFVTKQIHRLTGCLESHSVCVVQHVAAVCTNISVIASIEHLALPSIERYIAIKYPYRYLHMVTTPRLTSAVILAWSAACFLDCLWYSEHCFHLHFTRDRSTSQYCRSHFLSHCCLPRIRKSDRENQTSVSEGQESFQYYKNSNWSSDVFVRAADIITTCDEIYFNFPGPAVS